MNSGSGNLRPVAALNLRDQIEQEVRGAILRGTFKLGERLVESSIATQMGVSRAPVREVLSALEREGLVISIPRRGYFVIDFTEKDIEEIYSLRLLLEVGALKRAVERFSDSDIEEMQQIVDRLAQEAIRQDDQFALINLDMSFHEYICKLADHSRLYSMWNSINLQTQLLIGVTSKTHYTDPQQPLHWHQSILDAFKAKDLEGAQKVLTEHICDAQERAEKALKTLSEE